MANRTFCYRGHVRDFYHAHQLAWEISNRPNGANRDFLFRFTSFEDATIFNIRDTSVKVDVPVNEIVNIELTACALYKKEFITESKDAMNWLLRMGIEHGFHLVNVKPSFIGARSAFKSNKRINGFFWNFKGTISITDPVKFNEVYSHGVGKLRAFGFGMIVVK